MVGTVLRRRRRRRPSACSPKSRADGFDARACPFPDRRDDAPQVQTALLFKDIGQNCPQRSYSRFLELLMVPGGGEVESGNDDRKIAGIVQSIRACPIIDGDLVHAVAGRGDAGRDRLARQSHDESKATKEHDEAHQPALRIGPDAD